MTMVEKIKVIFNQLGFPQSFTESISLPEDIMVSGFFSETVRDVHGNTLGSFMLVNVPPSTPDPSIDSSGVIETRFMIQVSFINPQDFLKNISTKPECTISLDADFNFITFQTGSYQFLKNEKTNTNYQLMILFQFDINLVPVNIQSYELGNNNEVSFRMNRTKENMMSLEDEFLLIEFLKHRHNPSVIEIVPEFFIPSAYNFNSEDFNQRISLARMFNF